MDEQVTCHEWLPWLCTQQEGEISAKIQEFSGKPSKREKWIVEQLTALLFQDAEPLFTSLERATLFYHTYEALNKLTQKGRRSYKWSEDIKSVHRAKINRKYDVSLDELNQLQLNVCFPSLAHFPLGSWALQFTFTLRKPYISQDDSDFYILDNPVKKEWVFKVPYVAPSQWKGALRAAMVQELVAKLKNGGIDDQTFIEKRLQYYHLFGNEKDSTTEFLNQVLARHSVGEPPRHEDEHHKWQEGFEAKIEEVSEEFETMLREKGYCQGDIEGFQGHLHFYPTYFCQIGLEVINPHPRDTGAGKLPIYLECVPDGTKGIFTLFYVPLGRQQELSPKETLEQAVQDLQTITEGIRAMMTCYGFGAKTSSGFGMAEVDFDGATIKPEEFQNRWREVWQEVAQ